MKNIKICYTKTKNLGDAINSLIVKDVMGYNPVVSNEWWCDITGIGSGLRRFFFMPEKRSTRYMVKRKMINTINRRPVIIWSAGFLDTPNGCELLARSNIMVSSVRGLYSKESLENILGKKLECDIGDAGILAADLISSKVKKHKLGIIPHRSEKGLPITKKVKDSFSDSVLIDIEPNDPLEALEQIASCEFIISSSLHGLIFADSFRIPNKHIILSDNLSGDGFKFSDYYSVYSLEDAPLDLRIAGDKNLEEIIGEYCIKDIQVDNLKNSCQKSFHKYL